MSNLNVNLGMMNQLSARKLFIHINAIYQTDCRQELGWRTALHWYRNIMGNWVRCIRALIGLLISEILNWISCGRDLWRDWCYIWWSCSILMLHLSDWRPRGRHFKLITRTFCVGLSGTGHKYLNRGDWDIGTIMRLGSCHVNILAWQYCKKRHNFALSYIWLALTALDYTFCIT